MNHPVLQGKFLHMREAEGGLNHDRPVLRASISRPFWTKVQPTSGSASFILQSGSPIQFRLPTSGYLAPSVGAEGYIEFALTAATTASTYTWCEPYGIFTRVDHLINSQTVNSSTLRRDILAGMKVMDTCISQNMTQGSMMGVPAQFGVAGQPLLSSVSTSSNNLLLNNGTATTRYYSIPLRYICEDLMCDRDSLVSLNFIGLNELQFQLNDPAICTWSSATDSVASPTITVSNIQLVLPICYVNDAEDQLVRQAIDSTGLFYNTEVCVCNPIGPFTIGGTSGSNTILFGSMPSSVKYIETQIEGNTQGSHINCAYKLLTSCQAGITSYQYLLDYVPVTSLPVQSAATQAAGGTTTSRVEAYRAYLEELNARKRNQRLYKDLSGPSVDLVSFSGSRYLTSKAGASGASNVSMISHFRPVADLSSVSRELYDGTEFKYLQLQINWDSNTSYWSEGTDGVVNDAFSTYRMNLFAYCNRGLLITRGSMTQLY